jgi:hypothetical protein
MVFSACRLAELARMERPPQPSPEAGSIVLSAVTKQKQAELQGFIMRRASIQAICPVITLHAWLTRTETARSELLFCHRDGRALTVQAICTRFLRVFKAAGIPGHYGAYSLKHAVVTKLYNLGATDEEICAYGHWVPGSRTPRLWYYIPTVESNWLGGKISASFAESLRSTVKEGFAEEEAAGNSEGGTEAL